MRDPDCVAAARLRTSDRKVSAQHRYSVLILAALCCPLPSGLVVFAGPARAAGPSKDASGLPPVSVTNGSLTLTNGSRLAYTADAGLLTVGATDDQDAMLELDGAYRPGTGPDPSERPDQQPATARMSYTAYFAKNVGAAARPIMFVYDGGPGSSSRSLLMTSFGPVQVIAPDLQHPAGGPYCITENAASLLDVADLVFIDAPGTGFGSIQGRDAAKDFYGIDQDAAAFARFIQRFLTRYDRWNSPKYLFGHSYGTVRNAALGWQLLQDDIDLNGIISVSQYLNIDDFLDAEEANPGTDNPIFLALPSYAAIAWFHRTVPHPSAALEPWLAEVEHYATHEYADALLQGSDLTPGAKASVAAKLESYTGIPAATWLRANLRLRGAEFEKILLSPSGLTTGRLDARYTGPSIDPMAAEAEYDPFGSSVGSAVAAGLNTYARDTLHFGQDLTYQADAAVRT